MSFTINTNVTAMDALRNLNNNANMMAQSITRLSTGLRINSGADDPAGLIVSQQYQAQIGGLNQAIQNSQNGINMAKTADGALAEVQSLLQSARTLAVAAANTGVLSASQVAADQAQLSAIAASISRIASNTQFGNKKLLDGSAGVSATITDATKLSSLSISGTFGGGAVTGSNGVGVQVTQAATQATLSSAAFASVNATVASAGSFSINGVTFTATAATTAQDLIDAINGAQGQTGVAAVYNGGTNTIDLNTTAYGSGQTINLSDANGVFLAAAGFSTASGTDALATVTIGSATSLFTGSVGGTDGLTLTDSDGNSLTLTSAGNAVAANATMGQVTGGASQFQIGANANQTVNLSLGNFAATQLGTGVAAGVNMSTLDLTTSAGANQAIQVIDAAISQVSSARGDIGAFQQYTLESNIQSLSVASENLSAAKSTITDTDVAAEMTNYTKEQILQQAGMSVLAQANNSPSAVLKLLG